MVRLRVLWMVAGLVLVAFGCGDDDHDGDGGHDGHDDLCGDQANCTDTVDLVDGVEGESENGVFMGSIMSQNGLNLDENDWMVRITDADDNPVEGATVELQTFSVDCGHTGPCPPSDAAEHMPGMYMINPVHAHGGPWDTNVSVELDGDSDTITWHFCVDAVSHGADTELPTIMCPDGSEAAGGHAGHDAADGGTDAGDDPAT